MNYKTKAVVINRSPIREFDEKISFLTMDFGLITTLSFGSRSIKSYRNQNMKGCDILNISFTNNGEKYTLKSSEIYFLNKNIEEPANFILYQNFLKKILNYLPTNVNERPFYDLIENLIMIGIFRNSNVSRELILNLSLLHTIGLYPFFYHCFLCGRTCSSKYFFVNEQGYFGESCKKECFYQKSFLCNIDQILFLNQFYQEYLDNKTYLTTIINKNLENVNPQQLLELTKIIFERN